MLSYGKTNPEAILPYLNPEYWDGHTLGVGATEEERMPSFTASFSIPSRQLKESKELLQDRLARMAKVIPLETFDDGQSFDSEDYEVGTVVVFREEHLGGKAKISEDDLEMLKQQQLPARPIDVSMFGGIETGTLITKLTDDKVGAQYWTGPMWGIVGEGRKHKKELHTIHSSAVKRFEGGVLVNMILNAHSFESHINIGEVKHYSTERPQNPHESLSRINILHVVAHGETQRKKSRAAIFGGRLSVKYGRT